MRRSNNQDTGRRGRNVLWNQHGKCNDSPGWCVKRLKRGVKGRPSSGDKVSGAAMSMSWEQEATDGSGGDVTLPELVQIMKWDHARKPHQSVPSPRLDAVLWNNLSAYRQDHEARLHEFMAHFPISWLPLGFDKSFYPGGVFFLPMSLMAHPVQTPAGRGNSPLWHTELKGLPLPLIWWAMVIVLDRNFGLSCLCEPLIPSWHRISPFHRWL